MSRPRSHPDPVQTARDVITVHTVKRPMCKRRHPAAVCETCRPCEKCRPDGSCDRLSWARTVEACATSGGTFSADDEPVIIWRDGRWRAAGGDRPPR
jgi:hypothetical protein